MWQRYWFLVRDKPRREKKETENSKSFQSLFFIRLPISIEYTFGANLSKNAHTKLIIARVKITIIINFGISKIRLCGVNKDKILRITIATGRCIA